MVLLVVPSCVFFLHCLFLIIVCLVIGSEDGLISYCRAWLILTVLNHSAFCACVAVIGIIKKLLFTLWLYCVEKIHWQLAERALALSLY